MQDNSRRRLVVLAIEVGGRWSTEAVDLIRQLAKAPGDLFCVAAPGLAAHAGAAVSMPCQPLRKMDGPSSRAGGSRTSASKSLHSGRAQGARIVGGNFDAQLGFGERNDMLTQIEPSFRLVLANDDAHGSSGTLESSLRLPQMRWTWVQTIEL